MTMSLTSVAGPDLRFEITLAHLGALVVQVKAALQHPPAVLMLPARPHRRQLPLLLVPLLQQRADAGGLPGLQSFGIFVANVFLQSGRRALVDQATMWLTGMQEDTSINCRSMWKRKG